jgi:hypothetical protein
VTTVYWREGYPAKVKASVAHKELTRLANSHGRVTPEVVVQDARRSESPLHEAFEWDDTQAANDWRMHQARGLIGSLVIEVEDRPVRAFQVVLSDEQRAYVGTEDVLVDPILREQVVSRALREFKSWRKRYETLHELSDIFEAADRLTG